MFSFVRQFGLQRRLAEIEEARREEEVASKLEADVTARFESYMTSRGDKPQGLKEPPDRVARAVCAGAREAVITNRSR